MKKLISLLLVALFVALVACENVEYPSESSKIESDADLYEQLESQLPQTDSESAANTDFVILTDDVTAFHQGETLTGSINMVLEERNTFLRDKYGANVIVRQVTIDELFDELSEALLSGTHACDMISVSAKETVKLYTAGLLGDLNALPDFNIENGFFDEKLSKSLATNNSLYMIGDPTALVYDKANVMFFNRDLVVATEGDPDIETLVMQGKWTWDKFDEYCRSSAAKVYNHSTADLNTDVFAFGAYDTTNAYPLAIFTSTGSKLIDNTYKNPGAITMEADSVISVAEMLMSYYNVRGRYPVGEGEELATVFESNRLVFFSNELSYLYALRDGTEKGSNYGFLPMPKSSEEQSEYYCLLSEDARVIAIPKTIENKDESYKKYVSAIISATCAIGGKTMRDAYINSQLALYLNSNSEAVMLKTICDSITFDFAHIYGSEIETIKTPTTKAIIDYFGYGSRLSSSLRQGKKTFEQYCAEKFV